MLEMSHKFLQDKAVLTLTFKPSKLIGRLAIVGTLICGKEKHYKALKATLGWLT